MEPSFAKLHQWKGFGQFATFARDPLAWTLTIPKHGDLVDTLFAGDRVLFATHPALAEQVLLRQSSAFTKDWFLRDLKRFLGEGLLTAEGDFWKRQRRLAQPAFHRERIAKYATTMVTLTAQMADRWRVGETRNVHSDYLAVTLDIVVQTLFGADLGEDAKVIEHCLEAIMNWYAQPVVIAMPTLHTRWYKPFREVMDRERDLDRVIRGLIARRRADPRREGDDLLSMLLAAQDEDGSHMTDAQVRDEVMTVFLAGHETTALLLSWTTWLLAEHPAVQHRLNDELRSVLGDRDPTLDDLPKLKLTEAVLKEAMRLRPPAWALGREASQPFELLGRSYPTGAQVWINVIGMHQDARYFPEPLKFDPDRWMDGLEKRLPKFAYIPFGGGPRVCIGNTFAMMEATLMLAVIARRWRVWMAPGAKVEPMTTITLRPKGGVKVVLGRPVGVRSSEA